MPERIYTSADDGRLEALEETPFSSEDEIQALIAEHPELLDGEQIRPGDARRWILVTREKGIAPLSDAAARWAVDHLIIDQDAVPTLVELKRRTSKFWPSRSSGSTAKPDDARPASRSLRDSQMGTQVVRRRASWMWRCNPMVRFLLGRRMG